MRVCDIEHILRQRFSPTILEVIDDTSAHAGHVGVRKSGGGHYRVIIVAAGFKGKTILEKHRMVYDALFPHGQGHIHALSILARSPS